MTNTTRLQLRHIAFRKQKCRCFYCELPIWEGAVESFAVKHGISVVRAKKLQSTAEHLVAQQDGVRDTPENIVAACAWFNPRRHAGPRRKAPEPLAYKRHIAKRMAMGKWHPTGLRKVFKSK